MLQIAKTARFTGFGYPRFFWAWDFYACILGGDSPRSRNTQHPFIKK